MSAKQGQRGRQMSGMVGTEGAGRLIGPALGGLLAAWSIRVPFVAHGVLALLAIVPSFFSSANRRRPERRAPAKKPKMSSTPKP